MENKEKKFTGVSYLIGFYQEVEQLTHNYSVYVNQFTELKSKNSVIESLSESERQQLQAIVNAVRHNCTKAFIMYSAISKNLKNEPKKEIEKQYIKIRDNYIIDISELQKFVTELNSYLVESVIGQLLETNQDIVNSVFNDGNPK